MKYAAYTSVRERDEPRREDEGRLSRLEPQGQPILAADSLEELRRKALACLREDPDRTLYLADPDGVVREVLSDEEHRAAKDRRSRRGCMAVVILVFCLTTLVLGLPTGPSLWCLGALAGASLLYVLAVKTDVLNEVEAAIGCWLLLVVILLLLLKFAGPGEQAPETAPETRPPPGAGSPER
jgi:Flp pilus assembly protein TadB